MDKLTLRKDFLYFVLIALYLYTLDSFLSMYEKRWQDQAVEHGCGYYHPETDRFKWIDK